MRKAPATTLSLLMPHPSLPRALAAALLLLALAPLAAAQGYTTAVGLRVGQGFGLSATQLVGKRYTVEAIAQNRFGTDAFTMTLIGRRHFNLGIRRVNFFLGAGLHKGWGYEEEGQTANPLGLTAQAGAELTLGRTSITFDYLPQVHLAGRVVPVSFGSALGLRYVLIPRKSRVNLRYPWETKEEQRERQRARDKRKKEQDRAREKRRKARRKADRRGDKPSLRERLGL